HSRSEPDDQHAQNAEQHPAKQHGEPPIRIGSQARPDIPCTITARARAGKQLRPQMRLRAIFSGAPAEPDVSLIDASPAPGSTLEVSPMSEIRRFLLADLLLLASVVAVAAGVRAGYLVWVAEGGAGPLRVQEAPDDLGALIDGVQNHLWFGAQAPFAEGE